MKIEQGRPRRRTGITEKFWKDLDQDKQFYWKGISKAIAIVVSFFVTKTGIYIVDGFLMLFTTVLPMLIVEDQRTHTRLSVKLSKRLVRICVNLASYGAMIIGMLHFSHAVLGAFSKTYQSLNHEGVIGVLARVLAVIATPIAARNVFKKLGYWELVYTLPRQRLTKLLAGRRYKVRFDFEFYEFELMVLLVCFAFADMIALGLIPFLQVYKALSQLLA